MLNCEPALLQHTSPCMRQLSRFNLTPGATEISTGILLEYWIFLKNIFVGRGLAVTTGCFSFMVICY